MISFIKGSCRERDVRFKPYICHTEVWSFGIIVLRNLSVEEVVHFAKIKYTRGAYRLTKNFAPLGN